ncbi:hypothetical protein ACH4TP_38180 [Streptomyces sp. NPDC021012]|uniref:hypothetical protein n=1 Tax=Streptomyces sp. NPDC021012 TaxID=3365107 RepID=UPI00379D35FA
MNQDRTKSQSSLPRPDFHSEALRRASIADMAVSRSARRTFAEMKPGFTRQPVLQLAPNVRFLPTAVWDDGDGDVSDVCPLCEHWTCICGQGSTAPVPSARAAAPKAVA